MTITIATRADVRAAQLHRFVSISVHIVNSMPTLPGNLGMRTTNSGLAWFTLTIRWGHVKNQLARNRIVSRSGQQAVDPGNNALGTRSFVRGD